jgi:hypothetical protein
MSTIDDLLLAGGNAGKSMTFEQIGKSYSGTVFSVESRQATDLSTGEGKVWKDGSPAMQLVIGIQTDERNPELENDDGIRYDYVKMWGEQKKALRASAQAAGGAPEPGDFYGVKFVREIPSKTRGFNATKVYEYTIRKANPADSALGVAAPQAAPVAQVQQAAPVAQVPQAAPAGQLTPQQEEMVKTLISKALTDEQITSIVDGANPQAIAALRVQQGALVAAGF